MQEVERVAILGAGASAAASVVVVTDDVVVGSPVVGGRAVVVDSVAGEHPTNRRVNRTTTGLLTTPR